MLNFVGGLLVVVVSLLFAVVAFLLFVVLLVVVVITLPGKLTIPPFRLKSKFCFLALAAAPFAVCPAGVPPAGRLNDESRLSASFCPTVCKMTKEK